MNEPAIPLSQVKLFGSRFARPECVLATAAGDVFASDRRGGVSHVLPHGEHRLYVGATLDLAEAFHPNGIALQQDGSFLGAHLGMHEGGLFRLTRDGQLTPVLREVDGETLPSTNFVVLDSKPGRVWITVSTRRTPRMGAFTRAVQDGFIILLDEKGARIVADGLCFANECRVDPTGTWLYVNETYKRELTRFRIGADGSLSGRETVTQFGPGEFPDGLVFDAEGGAWVTTIVANRVLRVARDGSVAVMLEEHHPEHVEEVERAYQAGLVDRSLLDHARARILANVSSMAFCGPDLRTGLFGVLLADRLPTAPLPFTGAAPPHWTWR
ncbi:gluconolactonase [Alsobacter soli]|uniref:Gluconolactonase n=1 Tax=Alsobacter soli TaxID=2109933 RepID=A0A2T1HQA8_9HYPH|nr:SMP-30/gluconolactonase/LRE family protein [Alsobacter soli]PSC03844.1 gluconolactonase [Alsobacter soli]